MIVSLIGCRGLEGGSFYPEENLCSLKVTKLCGEEKWLMGCVFLHSTTRSWTSGAFPVEYAEFSGC